MNSTFAADPEIHEIKPGGNVKVILKTPLKHSSTRTSNPLLKPDLLPMALKSIIDQEHSLPMEHLWWEEDENSSLLPTSLFSFLCDL